MSDIAMAQLVVVKVILLLVTILTYLSTIARWFVKVPMTVLAFLVVVGIIWYYY